MANYDTSIRVSTKVNTDALKNAQREVDKYYKKLLQLLDRQEQLGEGGADKSSKMWKQLEVAIEQTDGHLKEAESYRDSLLEGMSEGFDRAKESAERLNRVLDNTEGVSEGFDKAKESAERLNRALDNTEGMSEGFDKAKESAEGLNKTLNNTEELAAGFDEAGKSAEKFGKKLQKSTKKSGSLLNTLAARLKGIALSLLIFNWITKAFNAMVSAAKEGFQNLAQYSDKYNAAMSALKSQSAQLKNSLAAAFEPVANVIIPYITKLVYWLNTAIEAMTRFMAAISGKSTYTKAKKQTIDYATSLNAAASSAKKALAAFDELTLLEKNDSSGSGELTGADAFETGTIDEKTLSIADALKNKLIELKSVFQDGYDFGLGDAGEKISSIKESLESVRQSLTDIFTDPEVGRSAQDCVDSVLYCFGAISGSFTSIGLTIAQNLAGGISKYLKQNTGRIKQYLTNMFDIGTGFNNLIANFARAFANVFSAFGDENGQELTANLVGIFADSFMRISELAAQYGLDTATLYIQPFIDNQESLRAALDGFLGVLSETSGTVKEGIDQAFDHMTEVYTEDVKPFFDSVTAGLSRISDSFLEYWNNDMQPVLDRWAKKFDEVWNGHLQPVFNKLGDVIGKVCNLLQVLWKNNLEPLMEWTIDNILPVLTPILEAVGNMFLDLSGTVGDVVSGILDVLGGLIDFIAGVFAGDWELAWEGIKEIFKGVFNAIMSIAETSVNGIVELVNGIIEGINKVGEKIGIDGMIPTLDTVSLPRLANGAVIQGGRPFAAILGDQPSGQTNIEAPLDTIKQAVAEVIGSSDGNEYTFVAEIDGNEIFRETVRQDRLYRKSSGRSAFLY